MGSYLIVDEKQNNSKAISYLMINLLRELFPRKMSLFDGEESFALTQEEVAITLNNAIDIINDDVILKLYIDNHKENYGMDEDFQEIKENFEYIQKCFAKILSEMVFHEKSNIICEWE